jgi:hypothetical protein
MSEDERREERERATVVNLPKFSFLIEVFI